MATFDVSFLNPKLRKSSSQDYGFLVDQLDIKRSQLESDGKLSPGDYDLLSAEAQKIYAHPGLTPAQRSNIEVKIANFAKEKKLTQSRESNNLSRLNREVQDDQTKIGLRFSNDPAKFLEAQAALQNTKIDRLSDAINYTEAAGDDSSEYVNELNATLDDYNDTLQALEDVRGYASGSAPKTNYAAYLVTNSQGEVVDLKVGRVGSQSGYVETNGIYGGLPVYGKVNRKEYGKNVFVLGNKTYSATDVVTMGPDGTMKPSVLIDTSMQKGKSGFSVAQSGYSQVDLASVKPQSAIRSGGWVEGDKGFLYQRQQDGTYKKFVNYDKEKLGISDNDIIRVPRSFESGIIKNISETVDGSIAPVMPVPTTITPGGVGPQANLSTTTPASTAAQVPQQDPTLGGGRPNTGGAPTERAPQSAQGIAGKAMGAVKGFFGRLFGQ